MTPRDSTSFFIKLLHPEQIKSFGFSVDFSFIFFRSSIPSPLAIRTSVITISNGLVFNKSKPFVPFSTHSTVAPKKVRSSYKISRISSSSSTIKTFFPLSSSISVAFLKLIEHVVFKMYVSVHSISLS